MPENSIVLELQKFALESNSSASDLLRKALVLAVKLNITEFEDWATKELEGYSDDKVPPYRKTQADLFGDDGPYGRKSIIFGNSDHAEIFLNISIPNGCPDLECMLKSSDCEFEAPLTSKQMNNLRRGLSEYPPVSIHRIISVSSIHGILEMVKSIVLKWSLNLEKEGILGEGLTFSSEEKLRAAQSVTFNIENFQGIAAGVISGGNISQSNTLNVQKGDLTSLLEVLGEHGISHDDLGSLRQCIESDGAVSDSGHFGSKVSSWMGGMIAKAAEGIWKIGTSTAAALLTEALKRYYGLIK